MFQFISVFLHYLVQALVRSAMNQYSFYIVLVFWNILVLVLVLVKKIAIILVLVFVTKIALVPTRAFFHLLGSFSARTAHPKKRGFSLNAPKKCIVFGCICLDQFAQGSNFLLLPPKTFSVGRLRL